MTLYATKYKQIEFKQQNYTNSNIKSYSMRISVYGDYIEAKIFDYKSRKTHYFKINDIKSKNEITLNFTYQNSYNLDTREGFYPKYVYDFETVEENTDFKKVKLNAYKNSKSKKSIFYFDLKLKPNDSNLFHAFRLSCIHGFEFIEKFDINENYIVESAKSVTHDGQIIEHTLLECKKIDLTLKVK
ncbi:hypothetical protein FBFR_01085 [Flavobacterium fryxellicola]|uniref:Uncharacterized protein n=2 Tax=Flavobacterium fryxellicola TaxID=249352 RepID=A0A168AGQ0_9FLAO|nr:hypothetical protein FBFR_01085 [Flavobacterium fryxellicola]